MGYTVNISVGVYNMLESSDGTNFPDFVPHRGAAASIFRWRRI